MSTNGLNKLSGSSRPMDYLPGANLAVRAMNHQPDLTPTGRTAAMIIVTAVDLDRTVKAQPTFHP